MKRKITICRVGCFAASVFRWNMSHVESAPSTLVLSQLQSFKMSCKGIRHLVQRMHVFETQGSPATQAKRWLKYFQHYFGKKPILFSNKNSTHLSKAAAAALMIVSRCNSNHLSLCTYCPSNIKAWHALYKNAIIALQHWPARLESESIESSPDTARPTK